MADRTRLEDVELAIAAAGLDPDGVDAILVGLLRSLAVKIDRAGEDGPSDRVLAAYLSAQKDLARSVVARERAAAVSARSQPAEEPKPSPDPSQPPQLHVVEESALAKLRRQEAARRSKQSRAAQ